VVEQLTTIDGAIGFGLLRPPPEVTLEVLVIAPYKSQVEELRRQILATDLTRLKVDVLSVDAVQGREADLALFSVTRSNPQGDLGFLGADYWRRINVALSRARYGLVIVGDADFIRTTNGALRGVLEYIEEHPGDCTVRRADK
jgi:superfamily I DNA and/or RNA helicase